MTTVILSSLPNHSVGLPDVESITTSVAASLYSRPSDFNHSVWWMPGPAQAEKVRRSTLEHFDRTSDPHGSFGWGLPVHRSELLLGRWQKTKQQDQVGQCQTANPLIFDLRTQPKTIQGAVEVTRKLGLRYLRTDSHGIIHDDEHDKAVQINEMRRIYASAYLALSAARSRDSAKGFLTPLLSPPSFTVCFQYLTLTGSWALSFSPDTPPRQNGYTDSMGVAKAYTLDALAHLWHL